MAETRYSVIWPLTSGIRHPTTDVALNGGKVYIYKTGTLTQKTDVYVDDPDDTTTRTAAPFPIILTSDGKGSSDDGSTRSPIFTTGQFRMRVQPSTASDDSGTPLYDLELKTRYNSFRIKTKIADYTTIADDDFIIMDTDTAGQALTLNLIAIASATNPVWVLNSGATYTVTADPNSTETIDGSSTYTISAGQAVIFFPGSSEWKKGITDADTVDGVQASSIIQKEGGTVATMDDEAELRFNSSAIAIRNVSGALHAFSGGNVHIDGDGTGMFLTAGAKYNSSTAVWDLTSNEYATQLQLQFNVAAAAGSAQARVRVTSNNTTGQAASWGSWYTIWHSGNDGQGSGLVSDLIGDQGGGSDLKVKVVNIGDWDMDATDSVNVAHGLTLANIRNVSVMIINDPGNALFKLDWDSLSTTHVWITVDATNVSIFRTVGGRFDGTSFDSTSYNRGYITIWHV